MTDVFWDRMEGRLPFQIGGLELGAVPLVSALVLKASQRGYEVNGFAVRKSPKRTGLRQQVEGELNDNPIVLVDDLVNKGNTLRRVIKTLEESGHSVRDFFVFVNFETPGLKEYLDEENIDLTAPFTLTDLDLVVNRKNQTHCPDNTFEVDWMFSPPDPNFVYVMPKSTPVIADSLVFYGADNGCFYAVDQITGKQQWEFQTGDTTRGIFPARQCTEAV